jgi:hypothetical protein
MFFAIYSATPFSPYIAFRIAFSLALDVAERNPLLGCEFMFEALLALIEVIPRRISLRSASAAPTED